MKKHTFLKSLLSSLMAVSVISTTVAPVFAEDAEAEPKEAVLEETPEAAAETVVAEDAKTFAAEQTLGDVTVTAEAAAGVFPVGTEMTAEIVEDQDILDLAASAVGENAVAKVAVDITFVNGGQEIQPNGDVRVTITSPEIAAVENPVLVHVDDKQEELTAEVVSQIAEETPAEEVAADLDSFSVYAVVGEGSTEDEARATVYFYGKNQETPVATYYVKNGDDADHLNIIVADPNIGKLGDGELFRGWTKDPNYTTETTPVDIAAIRTELENASITEGMEFKYYAMIFKAYTITYVGTNQDKAALGSETVIVSLGDTTEGEYTVNMPYTPATGEQNFEGWLVNSGKENIVSATFEDSAANEPYKNGTKLVVKGNVTLSVDAPYGKWLIFHENGGTYVAPQFIKDGNKPTEPNAANMKKNGYTFAGWYDAETGGSEFDFDQTLTNYETAKIDVYARWTVNTSANFAVIVWKEKANSDGYDYADSRVLSASVGSTVTVTNSNANVYVNGNQYTYTCETGFSYDHSDTGKTVAAEGNTIVNIYIKRNVYTLTFQNANGTQTIKTISAKFEQDISSEFPISSSYPTGTRWNPQSNLTVDGRVYFTRNVVVAYIDIMTPGNMIFRYSANPTGQGYAQRTMNYWIETVAGTTPTGQTTTYKNKTYELRKQVKAVYLGVTIEDYIDLPGFEHFEADKSLRNTYYRDTNSNNGTISTEVNFYYTRLKYDIVYMDGAYFDGTDKDGSGGNPITPTIAAAGQWGVVKDVTYGADVKSYNKDGANYFDPSELSDDRLREDFVFAGWYVDATCTIPYTFDTMPKDGIMVYAKWRQKQYRVFLHPNAGTDTTLDWGSDDQQMNFRVNYGAYVSLPDGTRTGYEMIGWFSNPECTEVFSADNVPMTDATTHDTYNKETDFTDVMDKWGNGATTNADVNRFWVNNKLDLYVKWRQTLEGADGIGIKYDAVDGTDAPTSDTNLYKDEAKAVAQSASTPPAGKVFEYWAVWDSATDSDSGVHVYPGDTFTVLKRNAEVKAIDDKTNQYTVYLKAVYANEKTATPTHITWYANNGTDESVTDKAEGLQINEAVNIRPSTQFSYEGHIFIGWAKLDAPAETEGNDSQTTSAAKDPSTLTEDDLFLRWDGTKFEAQDKNDNWFTATQVAADENQPYEDLYAVWYEPEKFIIDHSSDRDADEELIYIPETLSDSIAALVREYATANDIEWYGKGKTDKLDLTGKVKDGHFYGGYYKAAGTGNYVGGDTSFWNENNAWTDAKGDAVDPSVLMNDTNITDKTYYLKEVPVAYLTPKTRYVYNTYYNNVVTKLFAITAIDDANYEKIEVVNLLSNGETSPVAVHVSSKYTVTGSSKEKQEEFVASDFTGGKGGYVVVWNAKETPTVGKAFAQYKTTPINGLLGNQTLVQTLKLTTPDGIVVTRATRKIGTGSNEFAVKSDLTRTDENKDVIDYK